MEAAAVLQRPVAGVWGGVLTYHSDVRSPNCANMQYIRKLVIVIIIVFVVGGVAAARFFMFVNSS